MDDNKIYIEMMINSLETKSSVLDEILNITKIQETMLSKGAILDDEFDKTSIDKEQMINQVNELNSGFEALYIRLKEEIDRKKDEYYNEIQRLKRLIKIVTDKSVEIQAIEKRNYKRFQSSLALRKNEIKEFKRSSKTASNYYKNMADQHQGQSYFLDKKK